MSIAIALRDSRLSGYHDYEPVSDGSLAIRSEWDQRSNYLRGSASDWLPTVDAAFRRIRTECNIENWDGQGAFAVSDQVIDIAQKVVWTLFALLPKGTPPPDAIPEADGEICISWSVDTARVFAVSVGEHGKANFAGQFGGEGAVHAWQPINTSSRSALEDSLQDIARYVGRLYPPAVNRRAA